MQQKRKHWRSSQIARHPDGVPQVLNRVEFGVGAPGLLPSIRDCSMTLGRIS
jgi:hypothetical protein